MTLEATECVVVEDSRNGLLAAKEAGMRCLITKSSYTQHEDFSEADLVVDELGDARESGYAWKNSNASLFPTLETPAGSRR